MFPPPLPADLPRLPRRRPDSHKGDYGRALLVGGSQGMSGAIALAGMATLRSGAGLVRLAVPAVCLDTVAAFEASYMTAPLPHDDEGRMSEAAEDRIRQWAAEASCVACGPGLGRSDELTRLVAELYTSLPCPLVLDADALFALSQCPECLARPAGPRILTPHPGEFRRLMGTSGQESRAAEEERAVDFAARQGVVLVLKGHRSLITDGQTRHHNSTGNPGMATGGSGDVLTGIVTALICQRLPGLEAARLGTFLHGLAGDLAARELGMVPLIARDLVQFLPAAFRTLEPS